MLWKKPYRSYVALISQTGLNNPTVVIIRNELSGSIVWNRDSAGQYSGFLLSAFPINKTFFTLCDSGLVMPLANVKVIGIVRTDNDFIMLSQVDRSGTLIDEMVDVCLEIKIYP